MDTLLRLPLIVTLAALTGLLMLLPALHAGTTGQGAVARVFLYHGLLVLVGSALVGLAIGVAPRPPGPRDALLTMVGVFGGLPLLMALPFAQSLPDTGLFNAWWEMTSSLTTTGASLYGADLLPAPLHLWRALAGWMGGLFVLSAATAILAPLDLGGFEIMAAPEGRREIQDELPPSADAPLRTSVLPAGELRAASAHPHRRLTRSLRMVFPVYAGLTLALWLVLLLLGDPWLVALSRALGTLSTSGVSPVEGPAGAASGRVGELAVFLCLLPALSRRFWPGGTQLQASERLLDDPELRLAAVLVALVALALFARHFAFAAPSGGVPPDGLELLRDLGRGLAALWGGLFNALSFLTTTGWNSADWEGAQAWSGIGAPGVLLAGLAILGGGVATTAGGIKLLRIHALARHGQRELERIVHPRSVAGGGRIARRLRREGAFLAFIVFMLFALSMAVTVTLISIRPLDIETAAILAAAALTNTGPLAGAIPLRPALEASAGMASAPWQGWSGLPVFTKAVLAGAMIVGRLETLAVIALFSPQFWRR